MRERSKRRFGSHLPINNAMVKTFPVTGVMELGMGFLSTPFFLKSGVELLSIEEDGKWISKLKKDLTNREKHKIVHNEVNVKKPSSPISKQMVEKSVKLFIENDQKSLNLLFIDNFAGLRQPALVALYQDFDFIVYHDSECRNETFKPDLKQYFKGEYIVDSNEGIPSTGFLINEKYQNLIQRFEIAVNVEHSVFFKNHTNGYELKWE